MGKPKFLFLFLGMMLLLSFASAATFDNVKKIPTPFQDGYELPGKALEYNPIWEKYSPVEVKNAFDFPEILGGKKLFAGAITEHTEVCEYDYCYSIMEIYTSGDDAVVDDVIFKTQQEDGSWIEQDVRDYRFLYYTEGEQVLVDDYNTICRDGEWSEINQTYNQVCTYEKVGEHYEEAPNWTELSLGEVLPEGNYKIKLEAHKKPSRTVDWVIETNGEWINEWAVWGGSGSNLTNGLVGYFPLDDNEASTTIIADYGDDGTLATNTNALSVDGHIGTAFNFSVGNYGGNLGYLSNFTTFTVNFWVYPVASGGIMVGRRAGATFDNNVWQFGEASGNWLVANDGGSVSGGAVTPNVWTMATVVTNANYHAIYLNGTLINNGSFVLGNEGSPWVIGQAGGHAEYGKHIMDEFGFWNRTLSGSEILELYNSGAGLNPTNYGEITLNSPADSSITLNANTQFNATATVTGGATLVNMSLWNDDGAWSIKNTTTSIGNAVTFEATTTTTITSTGSGTGRGQSFTVGGINLVTNKVGLKLSRTGAAADNVNFYIYATDGSGLPTGSALSSGSMATSAIDTTATIYNITMTQVELTAGTKYALWFESETTADINLHVDFVGTGYTGGAAIYSDSLPGNWNNYGGDAWFAIYPGGLGTSRTLTWNYTIPAGDTIWNVQACDSDGDCGFATSNYTVSLDATAPSVTIDYPTSSISSLTNGEVIDLNTTISDTNLESCWYSYNGVNTTIPGCGDYNFTYVTGVDNITVFANDSVGNVGSDTVAWSQRLRIDSVEYNAATTTTQSETFKVNGIKASTISSITATLYYDGDADTSTVSIVGDVVNISNTFEIPSGTATRQFYWEITTVGLDGTNSFNTSTYNQTVSNLSLSFCESPSLDGLTLNFTTYDTTTDLPLNSTFEVSFEYYADGGSGDVLETYTYQNLTENRSNYMFCLNSSGQNVTLDAFISYAATGYDRREYIMDNAIIGNFTQNIPLYLTETALTDVVTFLIQDQNYNALSGAIVSVQEWNVGTNTYSTIGMFTTGDDGTGILNLVLYDRWYRASVTYGGELVKVTDVQKVSTTTWTITVELGVDNPYDLFGTISHGLTFDNVTNITTFSWSDSSGYTQQGCMVVRNITSLGTTEIYNTCTTSVAGTINYYLNGSGEYNIYGLIILGDEYDNSEQIVDTLNVRLGEPEIVTVVSPFGKVISFMVIGTAGLIGVSASSPIWGLMLLIGSLFLLFKLGWLNLTMGIIWGLITVAIIIGFRQTKVGS